MDAPKPHIDNVSVVFGFNSGTWDFDESSDEPLRTPELSIYSTAADAAADNEGLSIVETLNGYDDLWFFAQDGSPLEAHFSQQPYINFEKNEYFRGVYSLHPGSGTTLFDAITRVIESNHDRSSQARIAVWIAGADETAKKFGWSSPEAMKQGVVLALRLLPQDMQGRLIYARMSDSGLFSNIDDALRND